MEKEIREYIEKVKLQGIKKSRFIRVDRSYEIFCVADSSAKNLSEFQEGYSKKLRKEYPMNMIKAKNSFASVDICNEFWNIETQGCFNNPKDFGLGTGLFGVLDTPAVREAIERGITDIGDLQKISIGGIPALDSLTSTPVVMAEIYSTVQIKEIKNIVVLTKPQPSMSEMRRKFDQSSSSSYSNEELVEKLDREEFEKLGIPDSEFFKELRREVPKKRKNYRK